ncbi:MAG: hypothetical protein HY549_10560 [Elusimicrobia bacterium]|nr:hypothetical protein [Elusimicrobiota bacterium]
MNPLHIHLIANHIPVLAAPLAACLLAYAAWKGCEELNRLALLALALNGAITLGVFLSGLGAEELSAELVGSAEALIEPHERWAQASLAGAISLGLIAAWLLKAFRRPTPLPPRALLMVFLAAIGLGLALARTAYLGGRIHHHEIQPDWKHFRNAL